MPQRSAKVSNRIALRTATSEAHSRLDGLISGSLGVNSRAAYERLVLTMMWGRSYYAHSLGRAQNLLCLKDLNPNLLSALNQDLRKNGRSISSSKKSNPNIQCASADHDLGVLYVFEGSALGARSVHKQLNSNGASKLSTSYLEEVGNGQPLRWQTVCKALDQSIHDPADAIEGAQSCFRALADFVESLPNSIDRELADDGVRS